MNTRKQFSKPQPNLAAVSFLMLASILGAILLYPGNASAQTTNLALNRPAACSPAPQFPCAEAVDGNTGTRWASLKENACSRLRVIPGAYTLPNAGNMSYT